MKEYQELIGRIIIAVAIVIAAIIIAQSIDGVGSRIFLRWITWRPSFGMGYYSWGQHHDILARMT